MVSLIADRGIHQCCARRRIAEPTGACVRVGNDFYPSEAAKDNAKLRAGIYHCAATARLGAVMPKVPK
jgi:hypothetical protein